MPCWTLLELDGDPEITIDSDDDGADAPSVDPVFRPGPGDD